VPDLSLTAVLAGHGDDVTISAFHPAEELIATASRDYFVRVYDFEARLVAKFDGVITDVAWLDWTEDGRELAALSDDGHMTHWPWAATQPSNTSDPSSTQYNDHAPATLNGVSYRGNDCGQAAAADSRQAASAEAYDYQMVIDPEKLLLACVNDGALGVWDISTPTPTPTPMPVAVTILPDDVWVRSCAFAGISRLVFKTLGAGYRIYDYLLDKWQASDPTPPNRY
jgi:toxoflavin biosynthesis protein ToxC